MPTETVGMLVKLLAVVGGGVVGGLIVGWLVRVLVVLFTGQRLPNWLHWLFRLLGALLAGWLIWLYVFGGGGTGLGGAGGTGTGGGRDGNQPAVTDSAKDQTQKDRKDKQLPPGTGTDDSLTVEVLGVPDLKRLSPPDTQPNPNRCYRLSEGDREPKTLDQVRRYIEERQARTPPLRKIVVVLYRDSPGPLQDRVAKLTSWAERLPVLVEGHTVLVNGKDELVKVEVYPKPEEIAPLK